MAPKSNPWSLNSWVSPILLGLSVFLSPFALGADDLWNDSSVSEEYVDPYQVLGITPEQAEDLVLLKRARNRLLAEGAHPDLAGSHVGAVRINQAYEFLKAEINRQAYLSGELAFLGHHYKVGPAPVDIALVQAHRKVFRQELVNAVDRHSLSVEAVKQDPVFALFLFYGHMQSQLPNTLSEASRRALDLLLQEDLNLKKMDDLSQAVLWERNPVRALRKLWSQETRLSPQHMDMAVSILKAYQRRNFEDDFKLTQLISLVEQTPMDKWRIDVREHVAQALYLELVHHQGRNETRSKHYVGDLRRLIVRVKGPLRGGLACAWALINTAPAGR